MSPRSQPDDRISWDLAVPSGLVGYAMVDARRSPTVGMAEHLDGTRRPIVLGVLPRPLALAAVLLRPKRRFVMVNLLVFKEHASTPHEGRTGREAYMTYAKTVERAQGSLGSTLLWSGDIDAQVIGKSEPRFEAAGLLEYANPRAFFTFALTGRSDTRARAAGLHGQWLLACTTEECADPPEREADGLVLVELVGDGESAWRAGWRTAIERHGGQVLWSGRVDQHVIGTSPATVRHVVLHGLPGASQIEDLIASDAVRELRASETRPKPWWVFSARTSDLMPSLRTTPGPASSMGPTGRGRTFG